MTVPGIWTQASSGQSWLLYPLGQDDHVIGGVIQALFKEDEMTLMEVASFEHLFIEEICFSLIILVQASHHICREFMKLSLKLIIFLCCMPFAF